MKTIKKKGFLSIDFLFSIVFLLMIMSSFFSVYQSRYALATEMSEDLQGKMMSNKLAGPVNEVYSTGGALSVEELDFPENIFGENYWIGFDREQKEVFIAFDNSLDNNAVTGASVFEDIVVGLENKMRPGTLTIYWEDNIFLLTQNVSDVIDKLKNNKVHSDLENKFENNEKTLDLSGNVDVREIEKEKWVLEDIGNDYTYVIENIRDGLEISWKSPKVRVDKK